MALSTGKTWPNGGKEATYIKDLEKIIQNLQATVSNLQTAVSNLQSGNTK